MTGLIFVVDHDPHLAQLVSSAMSPSGYRASHYRSGAEALHGMKSSNPELLLVGERNDETDGLGFITKLREINADVPVAYVASRWREPHFYRVLREDLKVALITHRPLKGSILKLQLSELLANEFKESQAGSQESGVAPLSSDALSPDLEKWRRAFLASVPGRMERLGSLLTGMTLTADSQKFVEEALLITHNLKGTALSWGLTDLGDAAERLESALKAYPCNNGCSSSFVEEAATLFHQLHEEALAVSGDSLPEIVEEMPEPAADTARILVVGEVELPSTRLALRAGIGVELIESSQERALDQASKLALDAALIEIDPLRTQECLLLARQLRDLPGYENLPLAFIVCNASRLSEEGWARAHAGGSMVIEHPVDQAAVDQVIGKLLSLAEGGRFRVLVVDDDEDMSSLVCRCLGQFGIIARSLNDPLLTLATLNEFNPDLLLLDVMMPGITGFEVCKKLRSIARWRDLPIIFLTAQTDMSSRITAYEAGADDYLPKPVISVELLTRVKARLEKSRELKERSERDLLTGLLMRRPFSEQAHRLISEAARYNFPFTLCLLDIDHFKSVNDRYGHDAGDTVLATTGRLLRKRFRVEDLRGRWGGEEFILVFRHESIDTMTKALSRVLDELKGITFSAADGRTFTVSFSAGMAVFPSDDLTLHGLIQVADRRLYMAKNGGRSLIVAAG